jgi:hypothetical protein
VIGINEIRRQFGLVSRKYAELSGDGRRWDGDEFVKVQAFITSAGAFVQRFAPPGSRYLRDLDALPNGHGQVILAGAVAEAFGIATALWNDIEEDALPGFTQLVHANLFSSYLESAEHLLSNSFKDAAAVIAGSTLEVHLRSLAATHGVDPNDSKGRLKRAGRLNDDLVAANAYSSNQRQRVLSWLGTRNHAAHGEYSEYSEAEVREVIGGIRDFIERHPA